ncbi:hypothetical protein ACTWP5_23740 [Streptomyces sp. 4N509B]|uniref:hypothetical protein n=1 Tax=Streptomyces sp. 4N509B TaxID=3457413 RepID=UPI003FD31613
MSIRRRARWALRLAALPLALLAPLAAAPAVVAQDGAPPAAFTIADPAITESSGLVASALHPGVYWTHNDSAPDGQPAPYLYAVDGATGETLATITLEGPGVAARDLEAVSLGPDGSLYVADIGDNYDGGWEEVWVYRLPEPPQLADATITPTVHAVRYEDGPRDAEALMVHPETGRVYVASKKQDGGAALYASPPGGLSEAGPTTLTRVADLDLWVTDGAFSPDGTRLFLRGYFTSQMYAWEEEGGGTPVPIEREVPIPFQGQGESVTFTPDGTTLMLGSEGEASEVEPVELAGQLLPESAQGGEEDEGTEDAGDAGDADERDGDSDGEGGAAQAEDDEGGISGRTALILVAGAVFVLAARGRLFGRGAAKG